MAYQSIAQPFTNAVAGSPTMPIDARRNGKYLPGQLVHTVVMDQSALECLFTCATFPCCCYSETLARATYMDIYTNGVEIGKPRLCCCLTSYDTSIAAFHHFDDFVVFHEQAVKGEWCSPFPFCCVNRCDMFGEAVVMRGKCGSGAAIFGMGNQCNTPTWCPLLACCFPISVMYGLAPGQANHAAELINTHMSQFKSGNWAREPRVQMALNPAPTMMQGAPIAYQQQQNYTPIAKNV